MKAKSGGQELQEVQSPKQGMRRGMKSMQLPHGVMCSISSIENQRWQKAFLTLLPHMPASLYVVSLFCPHGEHRLTFALNRQRRYIIKGCKGKHYTSFIGRWKG